MDKIENRYKQKISDLEDQLRRASSNSDLSNTEWL
jgi:hypothetical protein